MGVTFYKKKPVVNLHKENRLCLVGEDFLIALLFLRTALLDRRAGGQKTVST